VNENKVITLHKNLKGDIFMGYEENFKFSTVADKRKDLMGNPLFNRERIMNAPDADIIIVHKQYFEAMNRTMEETLGESMYDDL
jgi:hypothetical protein